MTDRMLTIAEGFWNIRGHFKVLGLLDVGTQSSLVRLESGKFVLLDAYALEGPVKEEVFGLTRDGADIEALINLHPFHTVHVPAIAELLPHAKLYGTRRHHARFPELSWQPERTESAEFARLFEADFDFMVPSGVELVPDNENLHFGSVLAFHRSSRTLHVDDTLNWFPLPWGARLSFHPTLGKVLERRPGAAAEFRAWAEQLAERCGSVDRVLTAHARKLPPTPESPGAVQGWVQEALARVDKTLDKHARAHR